MPEIPLRTSRPNPFWFGTYVRCHRVLASGDMAADVNAQAAGGTVGDRSHETVAAA